MKVTKFTAVIAFSMHESTRATGFFVRPCYLSVESGKNYTHAHAQDYKNILTSQPD